MRVVQPRPRPRRAACPATLTAAMARATRRRAAGLAARAGGLATSPPSRPHLERHVALRREVAACFPDVDHPYDALLEAYEPGMTTAAVREVFATAARPGWSR